MIIYIYILLCVDIYIYIYIHTYKYTSIFGGAVACFDPCPHSYIVHCSARSCLHVSCMKQFGTLCPAHSIQNYTTVNGAAHICWINPYTAYTHVWLKEVCRIQ